MPRPADLPAVAADWAAVEQAAVAAAEAVAAAAAAQVASEAVSTAQAAVDAARAAAAQAAGRAREVADAAAAVVAAAAGGRWSQPPVRGASTGTPPSGGERMAVCMQSSARSAASRTGDAQRVARRVELVAEAAATAAVQAAVVVAAQVDRDLAETADDVSARQGTAGDGGLRAAQDAVTVRDMTRQGASATTIAAALNAAGSRTARHVRWTARTVATLRLAGLPPAPEAAGQSHAQRLAVAEGARDRAQEGFAEAQRLGGLGSWSWSIATDELMWSEQMYRLFGVDPETFDASFAGFLSCVHPDDRERVSATVASVLEGGLGYECEHRVRHPDGQELWVQGRGAAVHDADGAPVRLYGTVLDRTAAKLAEQREQQQARDLTRLAWYDSLTGLGNRSLLHDRLAQALHGHRPSVLLLDLDDFKRVNDTSGHAAGDRLLVHVAGRLLGTARNGDTVARLGGDEFAIVVEDGDPWQLAERILDVLAVPVLIDGRQVVPGASIGIATADGSIGVDELLLQADVAMYAAKAAGKHRAERFDAAMADELRVRTDLHEALREAVARGEIVLHYQPILNVATGSMSRVEALVRWQRPDGLVWPGEFLPLAEETGLIVGIGKHVLRESCAQLRDWLAADSARSLSVNVSPLQLQAADYAERTLAVLDEERVDPRQVVLEVTETLFLSATPALIEQLAMLRRQGIRVSIDDFGTGYSSLGRLHRLPLDSIKIDKSFVDLIRTSDELLPIITSMIVMAHALHLDVTAEGVETAEQASQLVALGCDYLQGFHFARPSPVETATGPAAREALRSRASLAVAHRRW